MGGEEEKKYVVLLGDIPDEGLDKSWSFPADMFADGKEPVPVSNDAVLNGRLDKMDDTITLTGDVTAKLQLECSRCLKEFSCDVEGSLTAVFIPHSDLQSDIGGERELRGEELDERSYRDEEIDLLGAVRDYVSLAMPMHPLCDDTCKGLCPSCGTDLNKRECDCTPAGEDNAFAALKKLKFD